MYTNWTGGSYIDKSRLFKLKGGMLDGNQMETDECKESYRIHRYDERVCHFWDMHRQYRCFFRTIFPLWREPRILGTPIRTIHLSNGRYFVPRQFLYDVFHFIRFQLATAD